MSELFGLEHARSTDAEARRDELGKLEAVVLRGNASDTDKKRYQRLKYEIGDNLAAAVDRKMRALRAERKPV